MLTKEKLKKITAKLGISAKDFNELAKKANRKKVLLEDFLVSEKAVSEHELYPAIAAFYKVSFVDLKGVTIDEKILNLLPEPIVQAHRIAVFGLEKEKIKVATTDPDDIQIIEFIKKKTGKEVEVYYTTQESIKNILKQYHRGIEAKFQEITKKEVGKKSLVIKSEDDSSLDGEDLEKLAKNVPVIRIVDTLLEYAIFENASDIHIEPTDKDIIVRYRIDGVLRDVMTLPKSVQSGIVARVKVLSNLKLDERRIPQDGRFKIETDEYKVDFRVSTLPVFNGEKVVMRLLDESSQIVSLEQLGFLKEPFNIVKRNILKPHGIILVTGPTGCGKTTTLYAILNMLNTPRVNISTIEDPIEYRMSRINQSQVNPKIGYTFATGLRALLRQDPNIIMVGEIRDNETAEIAVHSAMTGHLVLSTLHTNDSVGAVLRIQEMGIPAFLVASTTNMIIAQRLVRKICDHCKQSYALKKESIKEIENQLDIDFKYILQTLKNAGEIDNVNGKIEDINFYKGKGCKKCSEGYKGRVGIFELFEINSEMAELILKKASYDTIRNSAIEQKMVTMLQDGFIKAKRGITTIEEVLRVTKD